MTRFGHFAALCVLSATPALADKVTGTILAFDRVAQILVLADKSVWSLADGGATIPEGLEAGETVTIDFQTISDNGFGKILGIAVAQQVAM